MTDKTILISSLNRYERKKNIPLALHAFDYFLKSKSQSLNQDIKKEDVYLVIAGGYDTRLSENVDLHLELQAKAKELGIDN